MLWLLVFCSLVILPVLQHFSSPSLVLEISSDAVFQAQEATAQAKEFVLDPIEQLNTLPEAQSQAATESLAAAKISSLFSWKIVIGLAWLLGVLVLWALLVFELISLRWMTHRGRRVVAGRWFDMLQKQSKVLKQTMPITLVSSAYCQSPMTYGLLYPIIFIPEDHSSWKQEQVKISILHELAHIQRKDYISNLFLLSIRALFWFHPIIWIAHRRAKLYQEQACDDRVVSLENNAVVYAEQLISIVQGIRSKKLFPLANSLGLPHQLPQRIKYILAPSLSRSPLSRNASLAMGGLFVLMISFFNACQVQQNTPSEEVEKWIGLLNSAHLEDKKRALWHLGELENREAIPSILHQLESTDTEVRGLSYWALGEIKAPSTLDTLHSILLQKNQDTYSKEMLVFAIGEMETNSSVDLLKSLQYDPEIAVRKAAIWSLGEIGTPEAHEALLAFIQDREAEVLMQAMQVIQEKKIQIAAPHLMYFLQHSRPEIRAKAANSLGQLRAQVSIETLLVTTEDEHPSVRMEAVRALGRIGDPATINHLISLLNDQSSDVRAQVINALDEINL